VWDLITEVYVAWMPHPSLQGRINGVFWNKIPHLLRTMAQAEQLQFGIEKNGKGLAHDYCRKTSMDRLTL
jgi:hypothetical protein